MSTRTSSPPRRLVDDELWALLEPLMPARQSGRGRSGRPRLHDRQAVEGVIFVLNIGIG
jgi:transposase